MIVIGKDSTRDKSAAKEIVQDVFIDLWNRRANLQIKHAPNYLATAVKFTFFRLYYRKKEKEKQLISKLAATDIQLDEDVIYAKFLKETIDDCVENLPDKCKMVFKYSRNQGLRIPEIAQEMGISEKTVEAHLTKALKTLKISLKGRGSLLLSLLILVAR